MTNIGCIGAVTLILISCMLHQLLQPENPAQLGGKIYEMMNMALAGKYGTVGGYQQQVNQQSYIPETVEAEVVEPAEAGGQK